MRILLPLRVVDELFIKSDARLCIANEGAVATSLSSLRNPKEHVFHLKDGKLVKMTFPEIRWPNNGLREEVIFKTIELALDFRTVMTRYDFKQLPKKGSTDEEWQARVRSYLQLWTDLVALEKKRQRTSEGSAWPPVPWAIEDIADMPVVIWVTKGRR